MGTEDEAMRWVGLLAAGTVFGVLVADELLLKDGRRLRGKVEKDGNAYILRTRFGWVRMEADKVAGVIKEATDRRLSAEKVPGSLLFEGAFEESYKRGVWLLKEGRLKKGREELLRALGMRPHDVRVWLKLGFTPTRDGWRYESAKVAKRRRRSDGSAYKVCAEEGINVRELVESDLARLGKRLRSRHKKVVPVLSEQDKESVGWRLQQTPYGWQLVPNDDWKWRIWQPFGWPLYRGNRCSIVIDRGALRNLSGRIWMQQRKIRLFGDR